MNPRIAPAYLRPLSEYVRRVGGTLELTARFPNRTPIRIKGFGVLSRPPKPRDMPKQAAAALSPGRTASRIEERCARQRPCCLYGFTIRQDNILCYYSLCYKPPTRSKLNMDRLRTFGFLL